MDGVWRLAEKSRMDCVPVLAPDGELRIVEFRNLVQGDSVVLGRTDDGSEGILMHTEGFSAGGKSAEAFAFRTGAAGKRLSRGIMTHWPGCCAMKKSTAMWYGCSVRHAASTRRPRRPCRHSSKTAKPTACWRATLLPRTTWRVRCCTRRWGRISTRRRAAPTAITTTSTSSNAARAAGSIPAFIEQNGIRDGIMHACVAHGVPYVLAGSIRDDGPLPGVYGDVYAAQNAMREPGAAATTVICVATQLHTIATAIGRLPTVCAGGRVRPVYLYCVDISEFVTNKLRDRGSLSSVPIVANAQDFCAAWPQGSACRLRKNMIK